MNDVENECKECRMTFESAEQLANHVKRFCINSEYGNLNRLDQKYESAIKQPYPELKPSANLKDPSQLKNYGGYSLDQIKSNLKSNDEDFKKLERAVLHKREDELIDEIDRVKKDRQQQRIVSDQDEEMFQELLEEIELRKEREFACRLEKEQIKKQLNEIDSWKMSVVEEQKKNLLEKLLMDREELKNKQLQLIDDIRSFARNSKTFHHLQQNAKVTDNRVIMSAQYSELKQQLVRLQTRRDYLEQQRQQLLDNLERIRWGDFNQVRRPQSQTMVNNAQSVLNDTNSYNKNYDDIARMQEKIMNDKQRLEQLKRDQQERVSNLRPQSNYSEKVIQEIDQLKDEYKQNGGNDPKYIKDVDNVADFYKNATQRVPTGQKSQIIQQGQPQNQNQQFDPQQNTQMQQLQQQFLQQQQMLQQSQGQVGQFNQAPKKKKPNFNDPFESFSRKKEFFLQNNVRGVDLTREEQILVNLQTQEVDALRVISRIPIGTEIYRFKMEQYKELSTMRAEMEKIIQEQRLQRLRRNFEKKRRVQDKEFDNNKWVDDNRRAIIENRMRMDFGEIRSEQHLYDPTEGLVVHWDYILGLPRKTKLCQFVYAVYKNMQSLYQPKLNEPMDCEIESETTNRVLIGDSDQLYEIPAHPEVLLIVEVQIPVSKKLEENFGKVESYAWTQLDLFDQQRQLKRGKFKCPLYVGPTDAAITIEEIGKLEPIPNAWLHLRITYPNDQDFEQVRSIYPEQTAQEYNIPYIHLRGLFARNYEAAVEGKQPDNNNYGLEYERQGKYKIQEDVQVFNKKDKASTPPEQISMVLRNNRNKNKGVRVIIHQIQNYVANNYLRVISAIIRDSQLLFDQNGQPIAFNTTIHDPNSQIPSPARETQLMPITVTDPQMQGISNKASRSIMIEFHEEYRIFFDLQQAAITSGKTIYIGFQIQELSGQASSANNSMTQGGYDLIGWQFLELVKSNGETRIGRNVIKLYNPPLRRPPFDQSQVSESGIKLDYALYDFDYTDQDIEKWKQSKKF